MIIGDPNATVSLRESMRRGLIERVTERARPPVVPLNVTPAFYPWFVAVCNDCGQIHMGMPPVISDYHMERRPCSLCGGYQVCGCEYCMEWAQSVVLEEVAA